GAIQRLAIVGATVLDGINVITTAHDDHGEVVNLDGEGSDLGEVRGAADVDPGHMCLLGQSRLRRVARPGPGPRPFGAGFAVQNRSRRFCDRASVWPSRSRGRKAPPARFLAGVRAHVLFSSTSLSAAAPPRTSCS